MIATSDGSRQPGDAEKDQERLALVGQQIDLPQRLGDPNDAGQRRQARQKRVAAVRKTYRSMRNIRPSNSLAGRRSRRSAVRSAALARRAPVGKARAAVGGGRPARALLTAARKPHDDSRRRGRRTPRSSMSEFVKIAFGAARRPQGRNLRRLRRRGSQAVAAGRGADRRGGGAPRIRRPRPSASTARPRPRWTSSKRAGLDGVRLLVVGVAPGKDGKPIDFANLGGFVFGKLGAAKKAAVAFVAPEGEWDAGAGGRIRAGPAPARLPLRQIQDQEGRTATRPTTPRRR